MSTTNSLSSLTGSLANSGSGTSGTSGFGQGINVQQFVQFALANQQATITNLQAQQTGLTAQTSELTKIGANISNLDNAVFALADPLGVLSSKRRRPPILPWSAQQPPALRFRGRTRSR